MINGLDAARSSNLVNLANIGRLRYAIAVGTPIAAVGDASPTIVRVDHTRHIVLHGKHRNDTENERQKDRRVHLLIA